MKKITVMFICAAVSLTAMAQTYVGKPGLRLGVYLVLDGKNQNPTVTEKKANRWEISDEVMPAQSVSIAFDSLPEGYYNYSFDNGKTPKSIELKDNDPNRQKGVSMSSSAGETHSFWITRTGVSDTLYLQWSVGYLPVTLLDVYPASYFKDYVSYQLGNIFDQYPDSSRFDWKDYDNTLQLDARGIPVRPALSYEENGLFFLPDNLTEDTQLRLDGKTEIFTSLDPENPFDLLLYEDLAPGRYEFIAKPYKDAPENLWLRYPFEVKAPWYLAAGNLTALALFAVIVGGGLLFWRYRAQKELKERELNRRKEVIMAELKALRAQLDPHFLFNAMNSIQNMVSKQENEKANAYIVKFSRLLRDVLNSSSKQFHELERELQMAKDYMEIEQVRFPFEYTTHVEPTVPMSTLVPVLFLQPFIENAIKHGISGKSEGKIEITTQIDGKTLRVTVIDNGQGLGKSTERSVGLKICQERFDAIRALHGLEAGFELKDAGPGTGVVANIWIEIE